MRIRLFIFWLASLLLFVPTATIAQDTEENIIEFFSTNTVLEDDPKQELYNITIFSPDGQWKMQLNYHAASISRCTMVLII